MYMYPLRAASAIVVLAATVLALPFHAVAAPPQSALSSTISTNPIIIGSQLREALRLAGIALQQLDRLAPEDSLDQAAATCREVYVLIRAARSGMINAKAKARFPDPLLDWEIERTTIAWNESRRPVEDANGTLSYNKPEYVRAATEHLNIAVANIELVLQVLP